MKRNGIVASEVWLYPHAPRGNPYTALLAGGLQEVGWNVRDYSPGSLRWRRPPEVLHVHWPEQAASARNRTLALVKLEMFLADVRRLRRAGGRVVWTAHNALPHDGGALRRLVTERFLRTVDGVVHLSQAGKYVVETLHPRLREVPSVVVPHGDLTEAYPPLPSKAVSRQRLGLDDTELVIANFGRDRPYKGLGVLIESYRSAAASRHSTLLLAGYEGPQLAPDIRILPGYLQEGDLMTAIAAADLLILPFERVLHSGSVILGLGFGRPALAPRLGSLPELQRAVGADWLRLYDPPLTNEAVDQAVDWVATAGRSKHIVSPLSWGEIAGMTSSLYSKT